MLELVGNPEDWFSRKVAHIILLQHSKLQVLVSKSYFMNLETCYVERLKCFRNYSMLEAKVEQSETLECACVTFISRIYQLQTVTCP